MPPTLLNVGLGAAALMLIAAGFVYDSAVVQPTESEAAQPQPSEQKQRRDITKTIRRQPVRKRAVESSSCGYDAYAAHCELEAYRQNKAGWAPSNQENKGKIVNGNTIPPI